MIGQELKPKEAIQKSIRLALDDKDASVRQAATRSVATYSDPESFSRLLELLKDEAPSIRREAAKALGHFGDPKAIPALLENLSRPMDRAEEHSLIYALLEIGKLDHVMAGLKHPSPNVKRASLIVISQLDPMRLQLDDVEVLLHAASEPWANSAARQLGQWLSEEALAKARAADIQDLLLAFAGNAAVAQAIGESLNDPSTSQAVRENLLRIPAAAFC
jgi:HEAT repeat protein